MQPDTAGAAILVDAYGTTPSGVQVGVLLWEREGQPSGLEIYILGTDTSELPATDSLRVHLREPDI